MGIKVVICNVPLRSEDFRTTYPPLGAMFITQALKSRGYNPLFYDINYFRPAFSEIRDYFLRHRPDVIGISATVSTTYAYVKKLSLLIKEILPHSMIVVGGAITASSDIILKFTKVDICVTGEGDQVIVHLLDYFSKQGLVKIDEELKKVLGICFMNQMGEMVFTGYEIQIPAHEIPDPDYEILREHSELNGYIIDPKYYPQFKYDRRVNEVKRQGKKMATVVTSRGCIARCTFCHRWQKGLRILPVDRVIDHIKFLMERHDVGFISFGDEDFGASQKWVDEFVEKISTLDILYRIGAIRVDHVDLPVLKKYQESGCVAIHYGMESGSDRILSVMEKRATVQMNRDAAIKTFQAGLQTVPAAVIGMPGETYGTIEETARFLQDITEFYPYDPLISPNLLVALPGTPVYEYARLKGFLGQKPEDEEKYLVRISDHGGESPVQFNFTDYPYFAVQSWVRCLIISVLYNYYKKNNLPTLSNGMFIVSLFQFFLGIRRGHSFSCSLMSHPLFYRFRYVLTFIQVVIANFKECDTKLFLERCVELLVWPFKRKVFTKYISLRQFMNERTANLQEIKANLKNPLQLRLGR